MKIVNSCIRCLRSGNWQGHSVSSPHNKSCLLLHNQMPESKIKEIKHFYTIVYNSCSHIKLILNLSDTYCVRHSVRVCESR